ncbi:ATP-binding cassette domain-containing protein [Candidatus Bathyarchaeota archaeon]|nr:ATP-binding cassette domain-containing protein [Candidatus Bathyarchaeota archaeon]
METYEITVEGLRYQYGKNKAVNDISFKVKKGEIFSFLGPNGAGKTTTINVLTTLLPIQKGKISISGFDLRTQPDEIRKSIGIVFQNETLDWNLTVEETLEFHGRLYAIPKKTRKDRINELIQIVKLEEKRDEFVKNLSGGMKRKLEIARGLLTRPKVLFLDEPTIGLDPNSRMRIWNYIKRVNKEGVTIFLTTHYMDEADQLSDNICIIDRGKIIVNGFSEVLKQSLGMDVIYLKTNQDEKAFKTIKKMREIKNIRKTPSELMISVEDGQKNMPRLIEQIRIQGIEIKSVYLKKPTLDDVFIHYTGRHFREEEQEKKKKIIT